MAWAGCAALLIAADSGSRSEFAFRDVVAQRFREAFPLGVYWHWEDSISDQVLAQQCADLKSHHVSFIWFANGPNSATDCRRVCRIAAAHGLQVALAPGWADLTPAYAHNPQWLPFAQRAVGELWRTLEPKPFAMVLDDEPAPGAYMRSYNTYVGAIHAQRIPSLTTVQWGAVGSAANDAPLSGVLCCDFYPFFGSPHGPRGESSYRAFIDVVRNTVRSASRARQTPLMMVQSYQEIWGPSRLEPDGTLSALPGSGRHWLMPTPAQIHWQAWTSVALGAKGVIFFPFALAAQCKPAAPPIGQAWQLAAPVLTHAPMGLKTHPAYDSTPAYAAMGEVFSILASLRDTLRPLSPCSDTSSVAIQIGRVYPGDLVQALHHGGASASASHLAVVASPLRPLDEPLRLSATGASLRKLPDATLHDNLALILAPGHGALFSLEYPSPQTSAPMP